MTDQLKSEGASYPTAESTGNPTRQTGTEDNTIAPQTTEFPKTTTLPTQADPNDKD